MTREQKSSAIEALKESFDNHQFFYLTDSSSMTVEQINKLRGLCYDQDIKVQVVKNTLAQKALETFPADEGYEGLYEALKGPTTIMFSSSSSAPAKVISEFRKSSKKPLLKAAYIDKDVFFGDDQLDILKSLKSKEDLIGDIILLLQSPMKNVVGSLNSGSGTIGGLLKALEERAEN